MLSILQTTCLHFIALVNNFWSDNNIDLKLFRFFENFEFIFKYTGQIFLEIFTCVLTFHKDKFHWKPKLFLWVLAFVGRFCSSQNLTYCNSLKLLGSFEQSLMLPYTSQKKEFCKDNVKPTTQLTLTYLGYNCLPHDFRLHKFLCPAHVLAAWEKPQCMWRMSIADLPNH